MTVWLSWPNQAEVNNKKDRLTVVPGHAARDLHQDPRVAEDHDDQGQEEEARKGEHVVEGLLPVLDKTAMGGALGEVLRHRDGYIVKNKHLRGEKRKDQFSEGCVQIGWVCKEANLFSSVDYFKEIWTQVIITCLFHLYTLEKTGRKRRHSCVILILTQPDRYDERVD